MVFRQALESIAHAIVSHRREVETLEVGEEEGVAGGVPSTVAYEHCIGGVLAAPRSSVVVHHLECRRRGWDGMVLLRPPRLQYLGVCHMLIVVAYTVESTSRWFGARQGNEGVTVFLRCNGGVFRRLFLL